MVEPSEEAIRKQMERLIPQLDTNKITIKQFVKMLSKKMNGANLKPKRHFIRTTLTDILDRMEEEKQHSSVSESDEEDGGEDDLDVDVDEEEGVEVEKEEEEGGDPPATKKRKSRQGSGLNAPKKLSPQMSKFLGKTKESRPQVVKALWRYFKSNGLQNPDDKREIFLDDTLKNIFGYEVKKFTMFSVNKYVGAHVEPFKAVNLQEQSENSKLRKRKMEDAKNRLKEKKKRKPGTQPPFRLSDDLAKVVGKSILPRPQVTQRLWAYIKENNLQNEKDKRVIECDELLIKVMGGLKKVTMFNMNKHVSQHMLEKVEKGEYVHEDLVSDDDSRE